MLVRMALARLTANVPPQTDQDLRELAARRDRSLTDTLVRAVALLKMVEDEIDRGNAVHLVGTEGAIELRFL